MNSYIGNIYNEDFDMKACSMNFCVINTPEDCKLNLCGSNKHDCNGNSCWIKKA